MKKLMNFSLALAVVLTAGVTYAKGGADALTVKSGEGKNIEFTLNTTENVALSLYDKDATLIHTENWAKGRAKRTYNLAQLPAGTYFLEAESDSQTARYEITLNGNTALLKEAPVAMVYKPTVTIKDSTVLVSILNFNETPVNVTITETDGTEIYSGSFASKTSFFKKFDIASFPDGTYVFEFHYGNRTFAETIIKK